MGSLLDPYFYAYNPELLAFENAWVNFMKHGQINSAVIKPEVAESWIRCRTLGLDPTFPGKLPVLSEEEVCRKTEADSAILKIVYPYMESLYQIVKGSGFVINYVDADGYILKSIGDPETLEICKKTNSIPGASRLEASAGTSSIALAFIHKKPIMVAGAEHFIQEFHRWTCSAAPVLSRSGRIVCVLSVAGRYEMIHQHTLGMISSVAKAVENEIYIQKMNERLIESNSQLQATVEMVSEGVMYISNGEIKQLNCRMCDLIGYGSSQLLGRPVYEKIQTTPDLDQFISGSAETYENEKITLHGRDQNHSCFIDVQSVRGEFKQEVGKIMIFKRVDDIKALASKIKYQAKYTFDDIIGESPAIKRTLDLALKAAAHNVRVMIEGESGTGKEMFAQAIHNYGERKEGPFIAIDCGALPVELLESELFGYEGGAFTGAKREGKPGVFELAGGGTIFLDEVGNMHMEMQQKLLRALQENVITRVGGVRQIPVDVRVIAATNANLEDKVAEGSFRQDLYYRLNVIQIKTPSLKERREDIPLLVERYLTQGIPASKRKRIDKKALAVMMKYDWPGNVRQLINAIEYASIMCKNNIIGPGDLPLELLKGENLPLAAQTERELTLKEAMADYVNYVIKAHGGNISRSAKALGVSRSTVYKFIGGIGDEKEV